MWRGSSGGSIALTIRGCLHGGGPSCSVFTGGASGSAPSPSSIRLVLGWTQELLFDSWPEACPWTTRKGRPRLRPERPPVTTSRGGVRAPTLFVSLPSVRSLFLKQRHTGRCGGGRGGCRGQTGEGRKDGNRDPLVGGKACQSLCFLFAKRRLHQQTWVCGCGTSSAFCAWAWRHRLAGYEATGSLGVTDS